MPEYCTGIRNPVLTRHAAPEICGTKHLRGTVISWRGSRWRIVDREWDRLRKEWNYTVVHTSVVKSITRRNPS